MGQADYVSETQLLRSVAKSGKCRIIWTKHALKEMADRNPPATEPDVWNVLTKGHVTLEECKQDILWRVEGRDLDGDRLLLVVAVYEDSNGIKVITVF